MTGAMAERYDFTAVSDGTTLYYKITDAAAKTVEVVSELEYESPDYESYTTAPTGTLTIPESVSNDGTTYSVTSIGDEAFRDCSGLTGSLTIPNSVTSIGDYAFDGCSSFDGSLTIPKSVTSIGNYAFYGCSALTGLLTIPNSVTSIGDWAFYNCSGFTGSLTIGNSVTSIGNGAFNDCSSITAINVDAANPNYSSTDGILYNDDFTTLIKCPAGKTGSLTIPKSVTSIERFAFYSCGLTGSLTIPNSVTNIGGSAFELCSGFTGSLTIPNSVTSIEYSAFAGCSKLEGVTLPNDLTEIKSALFQGCTELATINFPDNIVKIGGKAAFSDTKWFADQAGGAVYIGKCLYAYKGTMDANTTITVNDGTTQICGDAFKVQTNLVAIILPESLKRISSYAFDGCSALAKVTMLSAAAPTVGDSAFGGTTLTTVNVPAGAKAAYDGEDGDGLWQGLTIKEPNYDFTAVSDGNTLYYKITNAESTPKTVAVVSEFEYEAPDWKSYNTAPKGILTIPETVSNGGIDYSVTSIGYRAFYKCSALTGSLTIPNSVTSIGECAFSECSGFTGVLTIGSSVTSIGNYAFELCSGLTGSLTIPNSVTSIGYSAFYGCSKLEGVTLPNDLTEIKSALFQGCTELATINFPDNIVKIGGKAAFSDTKWFADQAGGAVYIGKCLYAYKGTMDANTTITVNDGTTQICGDAFKDQTNLVAIILPESLTRISSYAFDGCSALAKVTMLSAAAPFVSDDEGAFNGIAADAKVYVPADAKAAYDGEGADADGLWQGLTIVDALEAAKAAKLAEVDVLDDDLTEADYTAESWKAFQDAMTADKDAINGKETVADVEAYVFTAIAAKDALEEKVATSLDNATAAAGFTRVQNTLYFAQPTAVAVYNVSGVMLHSGEVMEYTLPNAAGVYIIRTANSCVKVMK